MPWMTPPSTWLEAASGLTMRPTSWTATTRSTVTTPVPGSTATWAIWQPNVFTRNPSGLGPRAPEPSIVAFPSLPVTSTTSASSAPSFERMRPSDTTRSSTPISKTSAASPSSCRRTFPAALRTAGRTAGVVIDPPATGP